MSQLFVRVTTLNSILFFSQYPCNPPQISLDKHFKIIASGEQPTKIYAFNGGILLQIFNISSAAKLLIGSALVLV